MSLYYPCDKCGKCTLDIVGDEWCTGINQFLVLGKLTIDYSKQDPHEICKHFEPKRAAMTNATEKNHTCDKCGKPLGPINWWSVSAGDRYERRTYKLCVECAELVDSTLRSTIGGEAMNILGE